MGWNSSLALKTTDFYPYNWCGQLRASLRANPPGKKSQVHKYRIHQLRQWRCQFWSTRSRHGRGGIILRSILSWWSLWVVLDRVNLADFDAVARHFQAHYKKGSWVACLLHLFSLTFVLLLTIKNMEWLNYWERNCFQIKWCIPGKQENDDNFFQ